MSVGYGDGAASQQAATGSSADRWSGDQRRRPGARFVVVGALVFVFELAVIVVGQRAGLGPVAAVAVSFWFALLFSFTFQKLFTFGDKRTHHRVVVPQLAAFAAVVLFNFGFTILMTKLLQHDLPVVLVRALAVGITAVWNFYLYKTRIFKASFVD